MRAEEAVLFLVVTVLSFALVAAVVAPLLRKKRGGETALRPFALLAVSSGSEGPRCSA